MVQPLPFRAMAVATESAGTLPRPGPVGRGLRLALGLAVLYLLAGIISALPELASGVNLANPLTWLGMGYLIYAMPEILWMLFSRRRRWRARHVRAATAGGLILAAGIDFAATGSPNGGALGLAYGLVLAAVLGVLGISFLVAAAVAAPG